MDVGNGMLRGPGHILGFRGESNKEAARQADKRCWFLGASSLLSRHILTSFRLAIPSFKEENVVWLSTKQGHGNLCASVPLDLDAPFNRPAPQRALQSAMQHKRQQSSVSPVRPPSPHSSSAPYRALAFKWRTLICAKPQRRSFDTAS